MAIHMLLRAVDDINVAFLRAVKGQIDFLIADFLQRMPPIGGGHRMAVEFRAGGLQR